MWNNLLSGFTENPLYNRRMDSVTLLLGAIVLLFLVYTLRSWKRRNLPPGPIGLPIFGYYPFLGKNPVQTLNELAQKYGSVMGFYLGPQYVVFLNGWEALKDGLGQNMTLDRPSSTFSEVPYRFGFAGENGQEWVETRRLASKVLKDGLKRNHWEDLIQEELSDRIDLIMKEGENPVEPGSFFSRSFSNNVLSLLFGKRLHVGHSHVKMVSSSVDLIVSYTRILDLFNFSSTLSGLLRMIGLEETPQLAQKTLELSKLVSDTVDSKAHNASTRTEDSFITRFLAEIDSRQKTKQKTYVTEDNLKGTILALMVGGNETTRTSIVWALIAMAENPDKQSKVHEELDRVIGKEGSVQWSDRSKVPYTLATLLEALRWKTTIPFPAMRRTNADTQIQGYYIPKGTFIGSNNWAMHYDTRYWEKPDQFIPERFLFEDGKKVNLAPDSYNPFSYGKRNCPGKLVALMNMLQYFSALMQKFKVVPKEGDKVKYEEVLGLSYQARNAELRFIPR